MTLQTEAVKRILITCRTRDLSSPLECKGSAQCSVWGEWLHLESPGAASVPELRPVQGRVWNVEGNPDTIADERQLVA